MKHLEVETHWSAMSDGMVLVDECLPRVWRSRCSRYLSGETEIEYYDFVDAADRVQVAIFELEGAADLRGLGLLDIEMSPLAHSALERAISKCSDMSYYGFSFHAAYPFLLLEAAAILRDGWRPSGVTR